MAITLILEAEPTAIQVRTHDDSLSVDLADARSLTIPLPWYPRLNHATANERQNWQLLGDGSAIAEPDLDEGTGLLAGDGGCKPGEVRVLGIVLKIHQKL